MKQCLAILLIFYSFPLWALNVVLLNPSHDDSIFWQRVVHLTQGAANDLAIKLEVINGDNNPFLQLKNIHELVNRQNKPDYLIFLPFKESIVPAFNTLEKARISFVTLEKIYGVKKSAIVGLPQEKYKYWLGEMFHDNIKASTQLSQVLVDIALQQKGSNKSKTAIAITGDNFTENVKRWFGLKKVLSLYNGIDIAQVVQANWSRKVAQSKYTYLQKNHGEIDIVWAASDYMALGVSDEAMKQGLVINEDIVIGGFDWIPEALRSVKKGKLSASVGGHFLQGAWTLIKIFDHHNGIKVFKKSDDKEHINMQVAQQSNINNYLPLLNKIDLQRINFAQFSLSHPDNKKPALGYQFTIDAFIEAYH